MEVGRAPALRAAGKRLLFADVPARVRAWVVGEFGPAREVTDHAGGMSPGCASTVTTAKAGPIFVKAVGSELNAQTPDLFRHEIAVLSQLENVRYRPSLLGSYDDGDWVGIALEHVDGRHPRLAAATDFDAVAHLLETQRPELESVGEQLSITTMAATAARWRLRWRDIEHEPRRYLPDWATEHLEDVVARVESLEADLTGAALCHFDVRDDNLLIRPDGEAVIFDWGMARRGPSWIDELLLAVQKPDAVAACRWLDDHLPSHAQEVATTLLLAFGGSQAWNAQQPPRAGLPAFTAFTREDADRLLAVARLRRSDE